MATKLKNGDKVRIVSDWIIEKNLTATVIKVRNHDLRPGKTMTFVTVKFPTSALAEKYGVQFPIDEVRKVA
jgi:hypothetical protein